VHKGKKAGRTQPQAHLDQNDPESFTRPTPGPSSLARVDLQEPSTLSPSQWIPADRPNDPSLMDPNGMRNPLESSNY